jgi:hypothetical protein
VWICPEELVEHEHQVVGIPAVAAANPVALDQQSAPGTTPCSGVTNAIDVRYTVDHELIADWSVSLTTSASPPGSFTLVGMALPPSPPAARTTAAEPAAQRR